MAGTLRKAAQASGIWVLVLLVVAALWPPALHLVQLWMVVSVSILANILQPTYRPFEGSRTVEDRGTAAQILWTVYLTQATALLELDRKSTRLNSSHTVISYAVFCLKKKKKKNICTYMTNTI